MDWMLAEFTDVRTDYNFTSDPQFGEMYDLSKDPFQMHNLYNTAPAGLKAEMQAELRRLFVCRGENCN